ncbi:MAG: acyltransferase [archaeon]
MKNKIEAIDYLRGLAILAIIVIHILAWHDNAIWTEYTSIPRLFALRDFLQFSVVTVIICSGFSLYMAHGQLSLNKADLTNFYKKRVKRLLFPWWIFLAVFFSFHFLIKQIFNVQLIELSWSYVLLSFSMIGGIGFGWLVLLMLIMTLLFPFLKYLYDHSRKAVLFSFAVAAYLLSFALFKINPTNTLDFGAPMASASSASVAFLAISFIVGWSMVYMIGFFLEQFYNDHPSLKKELRLTFFSIGLFLLVSAIYSGLGIGEYLYLNKYPPSPTYISLGLMMTFILLSLFFSFQHVIHTHLKRVMTFLSSNSYWLFMWNALTLSIITPFLGLFSFSSVYLKLALDILLNVIGVVLLVFLQKGLLKIEIHYEKHHF